MPKYFSSSGVDDEDDVIMDRVVDIFNGSALLDWTINVKEQNRCKLCDDFLCNTMPVLLLFTKGFVL